MMTNTDVLLPEKTTGSFATRLLTLSAATWLVVATAGQWIFGGYILLMYVRTAITGDFGRWNDVLPKGYIEGDWKGNLVVGIHVLLASIMVIGGPLQLIPQVRRSFPGFHRWLGRLYATLAILISAAGLTMVWTRGSVGDATQHISISIQAIYIISFALLAVRYARARQFRAHEKWALRLFMVANGVWFFRIGLMCWLLINGGPVGFDPKTFTGPFLTILSVFTYAVPLSLVILEMYWYAQRKQSRVFSLLTATLIFLCALITGIGIFGATMGMWLPRMN
ncbi:DUF2306 domain-containing protein [Spirosoma sp. SC4-14]|uniref:DUF2306 domain-containing protein n=1 Tax=Spirosoma sp. SC4-14 TaxID=3128900 RepID=UPI0030D1ABB5